MSKKRRKSSPGPEAESSAVTDSTRLTGERSGNLSHENVEPWATRDAVPMPVVVVFALLLFFCDMHLMANRGEFDPRVYSPHSTIAEIESNWPVDPIVEFRRKGKLVYESYCTACHQGTGLGAPGQFPPLAGSDWALAEGPNRIIRLVLNGIQGPITVSGASFNNAMPAWGPVLTDEQIAQVVTYVRSEWGNKASAITPQQVAAIRKTVNDRGPWAPDELLKVSDK